MLTTPITPMAKVISGSTSRLPSTVGHHSTGAAAAGARDPQGT